MSAVLVVIPLKVQSAVSQSKFKNYQSCQLSHSTGILVQIERQRPLFEMLSPYSSIVMVMIY